MKKVKSFTLNQLTIDLLETMSIDSEPHVYQSAIVEAAVLSYAKNKKYIKEEKLETENLENEISKTDKKRKTS